LNLEVFCYVGLLRFPEQLEPSLALLPEEQRTKAANFLAGVKDFPKPELLRRWAKLREAESAALCHKAKERAGVSLDEMAPVAKQWCLEWLIDRDGRENS
jgi:hypothetical protein